MIKKNGIPYIKMASSGSNEGEDVGSHQLILTITKQQWEELVEVLSLKESMIKLKI